VARHLAPSSPWVVNYADDSCSLGRAFGEGDQKVTVFFDQYEPGDTFTLSGKTYGIVGFGAIGSTVARLLKGFGCTILYSKRQPLDASEEAALGVKHATLAQLLAQSDVVSLHCPLTPETRHLIDQPALARMKRSAYLINTSRGPVVDEKALAWALRMHLIAGAGLDVFEEEPKVEPELLTLENVMLVPHLGSGTVETRTAMADLAARNVAAVLSGQPPLTPVS